MDPLEKKQIFEKSHNAEKLKGGTLWDFPTFCRKTAKKLKGGPFGEKIFFRKKSLAVPKKIERWDPLVSPGMVCYAEKQEKKTFLVQFAKPNGAIWFNNIL